MLISGVKINERNYTVIRAVKKGLPTPNREDNRPWTIQVCYLNDKHTNIGEYNTKEQAEAIIRASLKED